jgi:DNA-binding MarR family transcriptional regulator
VQTDLDELDYRRLLEFRNGLRRFMHWSEQQARAVGLTPAQHQLLLAIRGDTDNEQRGPTIGDVARALMLRHHSVVGLVDRAVAGGLVERRHDDADHRIVRLRLTALGVRKIRRLSEVHLEELRRLAPRARTLWTDLDASSAADRGT